MKMKMKKKRKRRGGLLVLPSALISPPRHPP
jgi:hypothetical protein